MSTFRARPVCKLFTVFKTKQVSGVKLLYFWFERIVFFAHSLSWCCCCSVLFIVGIALSLQVKMLLFPLSGTQQARSSSFPTWPREVCDFIYLATSGCILIKVNLKRWTTYHSISSTRNPTVHSISSTLNPTVLHSQGWVWPSLVWSFWCSSLLSGPMKWTSYVWNLQTALQLRFDLLFIFQAVCSARCRSTLFSS